MRARAHSSHAPLRTRTHHHTLCTPLLECNRAHLGAIERTRLEASHDPLQVNSPIFPSFFHCAKPALFPHTTTILTPPLPTTKHLHPPNGQRRNAATVQIFPISIFSLIFPFCLNKPISPNFFILSQIKFILRHNPLLQIVLFYSVLVLFNFAGGWVRF